MFKRILFVEDETHIAELYAIMLRKRGYEVTVATDGEAGFREAQTGNYDLILLDLMLPNMSGMDILHALHDPAQTPSFTTPVVVLTNLGEDDQTVKDIKQYAVGYVMKVDMTPRQLADYVDNLAEKLAGS